MERKSFIKQLLAGSAGVTLFASQIQMLQGCTTPLKTKKLGIALVGLGSYSTTQLAPALLETEHSYLSAIVTGTKEKEDVWSKKYNIKKENIYNYTNFDEIVNNDDIDIVYIVLPNSMHAEFTIRAAKAGKHVICEKPMATSVEDCQKMINSCNNANVKLSIGYRLHFDPINGYLMELGQNKVFGKMNTETGFAFTLKNPEKWRLQKSLSGGGPLMDLGIYALQAAIYMYGELPTSLWAKDTTKDTAFFNKQNIEGSLEWEMTFPSGKALCKTSYEEDFYCYITANTERGEIELNPSFTYDGLKGKTPIGPIEIENVNQQAFQIDAFALNILNDTKSIVSGEMGLRDMYIIEKIYESARTDGKQVLLDEIPNILDLRKIRN
ncbi:Gfo/Idh/MocA family oxidoreductase [Polaribacter sp. PL03]|uniref:Gfo/Idh/MocA family protein n=1 Tax=Polaribacter sp. PL03 TaxID=3088353 RepID=UPI0029CC8EEC|nr:Gfo/Idh/MocA family oxidoreductase [Polaribacter sp. PL03]MDX6746625.1 Gfo/Idh/MocA family oxidoreductase [Polaribacter sp. PL03]